MRWTERAIQLREQFSKNTIMRFLIIFVLSTVLFFSTQNEYLEAVFGLIMIISGSILILFVVILLILLILEKIRLRKEQSSQKKETPKKTSTKKAVKKKTTAKKTTKKKTVSKKRK